MRKNKKTIISIVISFIIIGLGILAYYKFFYDANKLNLVEKDWLNSHKNSIVSINVPNNINVFGKNGKGIFYNFLSDFEKNYGITLNKNITANNNENSLGFTITKNVNKNGLLFYKDHFVIVANDYYEIHSLNELNNTNVGALTNTVSRITDSYQANIKFIESDNKENLITNLKNNTYSYIIVPIMEYLDEIITNNFKIIYHLDDVTNSYYINMGEDETLNSIITKYYNNWLNDNYENYFYQHLYNLFIEKLNLTQIEIDSLTNKTYNYGFITKTPYQILNSSKYGGTIIEYINDFSKFSKVDFTYTTFKNQNDLINAFEKGNIDLILYDTNIQISKAEIKTNIANEYYLIAPLSYSLKISNINDLNNETIYVLQNSSLQNYLNTYSNITIKTLKNENDLISKTNNNKLVAIDSNTYQHLTNDKIKDYAIAYTGKLSNYSFKYQNNTDAFYKLFSSYINYATNYNLYTYGLITFTNAESSGNIISLIAKYLLLIIAITIVIIGIVIISRKKVKLNTKIRKDEKLRYIDMLTSLKNRNYLNDRISVWNQNTVYPQAIIVIDLNNIKYLNDTFGHEEGDKQIQAAANILHQTQLDNTEIMRTDGNEFMVYLVGYNEKQLINYLKKLVKEFKELPYEYGAAFGFSMIVDDLKLIDDAINEATIQMRENKETTYETNESEN